MIYPYVNLNLATTLGKLKEKKKKKIQPQIYHTTRPITMHRNKEKFFFFTIHVTTTNKKNKKIVCIILGFLLKKKIIWKIRGISVNTTNTKINYNLCLNEIRLLIWDYTYIEGYF